MKIKALWTLVFGVSVDAFNVPEQPPQKSVGFHNSENNVRSPFSYPSPSPNEKKVRNPDFPGQAFEELNPRDILPASSIANSKKMQTRSKFSLRHQPPLESLREKPPATLIQGTSMQTWTFTQTHNVKRLQVDLRTPGRPLEAVTPMSEMKTRQSLIIPCYLYEV